MGTAVANRGDQLGVNSPWRSPGQVDGLVNSTCWVGLLRRPASRRVKNV